MTGVSIVKLDYVVEYPLHIIFTYTVTIITYRFQEQDKIHFCKIIRIAPYSSVTSTQFSLGFAQLIKILINLDKTARLQESHSRSLYV